MTNWKIRQEIRKTGSLGMENDMKNKNIWKKLPALVLILIIYITLCLRVYTRFIIHNDSYNLNESENGKVSEELKKGDVLVQDEKGISGNIKKIIIQCREYKAENNNLGILKLTVTDKDTNEVLAETKCDTGYINSRKLIAFELENPLKLKEEKNLSFKVEVEELNPNDKLTLTYCNPDDEKLTVNGKASDSVLKVSLIMASGFDLFSWVTMLSFTILGILIVVFYYLLFIRQKDIKTEFAYLIFAIVVGFIFLLYLPDYSTPDEEKHIATAYGVSNMVCGGEYKDSVSVRKNDAEQNVLRAYLTRDVYNNYYNSLLHNTGADNTMVKMKSDWKMLDTQKYLYFAPALGITIGRILHLGTVQTLLLGSMFNYILFVLLAFYAIRKIPFGKMGMAILCLMPLTLQQASSYSYDCPILAMALVVVALSLKLTVDEKINKKDLAVLIAVSILFLPVKGFAYAPILLMTLLPLKRLFRENKKLFKILLSGLVAAVIIALIVKMLTPQQGGSGSMNGFVEWANSPGYTIGYLIKNPAFCIVLFWDTLANLGTFYFGSMIGSNLGWIDIGIPMVVIVPIFIVMFLGFMKSEDDNYDFSGKAKLMMSIMTILSVGCIMGAMLLDWTPLGSTEIQGVQGRYFVPILVIVLLAMRSNKIKVNKNLYRDCMYTMVLLQPLVLFFIVAAA